MKLQIKETENLYNKQGDTIDSIEIKFKDGRSKSIDTSYLDLSVDSLNNFLELNNDTCDTIFKNSKFTKTKFN